MKRLLCLALAASLSACATTGATMTERLAAAGPKITAAQVAYEGAKGFAALWLPYLPPAQQTMIRMAGAAVEQALAAARTASTIAEQKAALDRANAAVADFRLVTGG